MGMMSHAALHKNRKKDIQYICPLSQIELQNFVYQRISGMNSGATWRETKSKGLISNGDDWSFLMLVRATISFYGLKYDFY